MTTVQRANACTERESSEMTSVFLLFSLLIPDALQANASELFVREASEPKCEAVDRLLAKYDAEYDAELALEFVTHGF